MTLAIQDHFADPILDNLPNREVDIDNRSNSSELTDYQVTVDVFNYVDKQRMRFVDENLQIIDYWEESSNTIWAEVPKIVGSKVSAIRLVHGNLDNKSDGDATFEFFDDFEGSNLDAEKWNIKDGSCSVNNGYAQPYGLPVFVITKAYTADNAVIHTKFLQSGTQAVGAVFRSTDDTRYNADFYMSYLRDDNTLRISKIVNEARTDFSTKTYTQGAATYIQHIRFNNNDLHVDIWKNDATDSLDATADGTRSDGRIGFVNYDNVGEGALKIDYIFTRKYASPEPTAVIA